MRRLALEPQAIAEAEGKAVKVVSMQLRPRPADREYKVLFLTRPMEEVLASQAAMIRRFGVTPSTLFGPALIAANTAHLIAVQAWIKSSAYERVRNPLSRPVARARARGRAHKVI